MIKRTMNCMPMTAAVIAVASAASFGADSPDLQTEVQALRAEVAAMRAQQGDTWLNERRAEEIKGLVKEVLSDADTRSSLAEGGLTAGWKKKFYLASEDHNFLMEIEGQVQARYIFNDSDQNGGATDETVGGFQMRRVKLGFSGYVVDPKITYKVKGAFNRAGTNGFELEDAWMAYDVMDGLNIRAGQFVEPFLREFMISSTAQQAVERSILTQTFTDEFTQGLYATYSTDMIKLYAGVIDGSQQKNTEFSSNNYEVAVLGRAELLLTGDWKQFSDFAAWSGQPLGVLLGVGTVYDVGTHAPGAAGKKADILKYTADVSVKVDPGINFYGALVGQTIDANDQAGVTNHSVNQIGFLIQAGVFIVPDTLDVFARYEYADFDGTAVNNTTGVLSNAAANNDLLSLVTVGTNYYFSKHQAKFTLDGVYGLKRIPTGAGGLSGSGLVTDADNGQFAIRAQFQLLF
jgi:phosphate-selective porin OprO/OprP